MIFYGFLFFAIQLLVDDPALRRFKSHKKDVRQIKKVGEVLTIVVAAGKLCVTCCVQVCSLQSLSETLISVGTFVYLKLKKSN